MTESTDDVGEGSFLGYRRQQLGNGSRMTTGRSRHIVRTNSKSKEAGVVIVRGFEGNAVVQGLQW